MADPEALISEWKETYQKLHGWPSPGTVRYERGWFVFDHAGYKRRRRRSEVEAMVAHLKEWDATKNTGDV